MKRLLVFLWFSIGAAGAQELDQRAGIGDRVASTRTGADFNEAIAPFAIDAMQACAQQGLPLATGEMATLLARVAPEGSWSDVDLEPDSAVTDCIAKQLLAAKLPTPQGWDWEQGPFPLTLRLGVGVAAGD